MSAANYPKLIAAGVGVRPTQVQATIELLDAGNTIPFIARYRKEATGSLDEEQLRQVSELLQRWRALDERREAVIKSIQEQEKLTPELESKIQTAETLTALEDLYAPYKPKRRTRASVAREHGLQPLADLILRQASQIGDLELVARPYLSEDVSDTQTAWSGARDIVAEAISEHADVRRLVRERALNNSIMRSTLIDDAPDPRRVYESYYEFEGRVDRLRPHQVLAINRGEQEKVLRVNLELAERDWLSSIEQIFRPDRRSQLAEMLSDAIRDGAERLLLPAIERDVRRALAESAELHAINVFSENLRALLGQPPLMGHTVLGLDPGFRTGCKVAVVDPTGKLLDTATIYPHEPQKDRTGALTTLGKLVRQHKVTLLAIGNGTASRETEALAAEFIQGLNQLSAVQPVKYLIVNEAGASVYSASPLARAEMPDLDVSLRGAVSIARRAQDPLAELVKIDPKSIGVGMYQHDVDQKHLAQALDGVVESVVNRVGVDVNTASPALLMHVAGIGPKLAAKVVAHRDNSGPFPDRKALMMVNGLGAKAFEQAAGFLRVLNGREPLDASAIHPESYKVAQGVLQRAGLNAKTPPAERQKALEELARHMPVEKLARELGCGAPTLKDILEQLARPGRDPRQDTPPPLLRSDVLSMDDLNPGMTLKGTVRNVVDFGAFVDIGVKQDGLLHRTQLPQGTVLRVGEIIEVEVLRVEIERGRISLALAKKP